MAVSMFEIRLVPAHTDGHVSIGWRGLWWSGSRFECGPLHPDPLAALAWMLRLMVKANDAHPRTPPRARGEGSGT